MPITTTCPGCKSLFRLPDDMAGAQVRCQKCEQLFMVPATNAAPEKAPVEATQAPAEDVVMATLSEPQDDIVMAKLSQSAAPKPPTLPRKPLPADRPMSAIGALALLLVFVIGLFVTGAGAAFWVAFHLAPPIRVTAAPPIHAGQPPMPNVPVGMKKKDEFKDWKKADKDWGIPIEDDVMIKKLKPAMPTPILFGFDGRASANVRTDNPPFLDHGKWNQNGPYHLFRISLKEGTKYHFFVQGRNIEPRLRIVDGANVVAECRGLEPHDRVMIGFQPQRTDDYLLWVTHKEIANGEIQMQVRQENKKEPIQVDLTVQARYADNGALHIEDSLDPGAGPFGPYRDYQVTLDKDREYRVALTNVQFPPVLRLDDRQPVVLNPPNNVPGNVEQSIRTDNTGKLRVRVSSEQFGVGTYTLTIEPKVAALAVVTTQRIIASFDEAGAYVDQRAFTPGDPVMLGRGSYKDYLLSFEKGKTYHIEMSQGNNPTALLLYTPNEGQTENVINPKGVAVTHRAIQTGTYRLRVFAPLQKERTEYTLRITTEP